MPETHEHLLLVLNVLNELGNLFFGTNLLEHPQDCLIGATMTGSIKSSDSTSQ